MRVIRINAVYGSLSTGRTAKQLDEELKKYGVRSTTVFSEGAKAEGAYRMGSRTDVKLHSVLARITGRSGYYSSGATKKLLRYLDEEKPDIVHLHNLHGNFIDLDRLFRYLSERRIPVAVTLHDCWWYTGKCCHYTLSGCMRWQEGCGSCPRLKRDIPSWFFDRSAEMLADKKRWFGSLEKYAVIGVSDWITAEAKKSFMKDADIIERIYNWVDTDVFRRTDSDIRERYGLEGKLVMLGAAGKWSEVKGLSAFLKLAEKLSDNERLVLIGDMPEGCESDKLICVPRTNSQAELAEWYSAADVFISLSMEESFGKVCAEALSCGTPIVVMDSTASPELAGGGCGAVIGDRAPETVLEAARKAACEPGAHEKCRAFAVSNFEMEKNVGSTFEVYKKLLDEE